MKKQKTICIIAALILVLAIFPSTAWASAGTVRSSDTEKFTVTFLPGDHGKFDPAGAPAKQEVASGESANEPTVIADKAYDFTGWDTDFSKVTGNLTVKAKYEIKTFVVTFYVGNHGSMSVDTHNELVQVIEYGESANAPDIDPDTGYQFTGWDKSFENVTEDIETAAQYTKKKYTLTIKVEGKGTISGIAGKYAYNTTVDLSKGAANPEDGYQFDKFTDTQGNTLTSVKMKGNHTIVAWFSQIAAAPAQSEEASSEPPVAASSAAASVSPEQTAQIKDIPEDEVPQAGYVLAQDKKAGFSLVWLIPMIGLPLLIILIVLLAVKKNKAARPNQ